MPFSRLVSNAALLWCFEERRASLSRRGIVFSYLVTSISCDRHLFPVHVIYLDFKSLKVRIIGVGLSNYVIQLMLPLFSLCSGEHCTL